MGKKQIIISLGLFVLLILVVTICWYKWLRGCSTDSRRVFDAITLYGFAVTIYAFVITIWQLTITGDIVKKTRNKIEHILSVSDVSTIKGYVRFIEECVRNGKYELANIRICDTKDFLAKIPTIQNINYDEKSLKKIKARVEDNMNALNRQIYDRFPLNTMTFIADMEELASFLDIILNQLKSIDYE